MICNECETVAHCTSHGCIPKQTAVDRLLDEAKLLADDRPVEVGNLPEWPLNAEHTIRRLVKALALVNEVDQEQPAQPQQEPVAWMDRYGELYKNVEQVLSTDIPLYPSPPAQRKPLTDEEIEKVWRRVQANDFHDCVQPFARAIEAKLKEKNSD